MKDGFLAQDYSSMTCHWFQDKLRSGLAGPRTSVPLGPLNSIYEFLM